MKPSIISSIDAILQSDSVSNAARGLAQATETLGFNSFAYIIRYPIPLSNPPIEMVSNYPRSWQDEYKAARYADIDPLIRSCAQTVDLFAWSACSFTERSFARLACCHGVRYGISMGIRDLRGHLGVMSLARTNLPCSAEEILALRGPFYAITQATHTALAEKHLLQKARLPSEDLTNRECEVLKWTADGKTSNEVASIMQITERTVNFHINNCIVKLKASNKLHAAVKAAQLGLLG